jgi:methyl coenzyme M reductase subunit C
MATARPGIVRSAIRAWICEAAFAAAGAYLSSEIILLQAGSGVPAKGVVRSVNQMIARHAINKKPMSEMPTRTIRLTLRRRSVGSLTAGRVALGSRRNIAKVVFALSNL